LARVLLDTTSPATTDSLHKTQALPAMVEQRNKSDRQKTDLRARPAVRVNREFEMKFWNSPTGTGAAALPRRVASCRRRTLVRAVALPWLLCGVWMGCAWSRAPVEAPASTASSRDGSAQATLPAEAIRRPESPRDLVANLHGAVSAGLLADTSTFEEQALTNLLGGDSFNWIARRPDLRMVNIGHFPEAFSAAAHEPHYTIYASLQVVDRETQGQVIIEKLDPSIRIATLLDLFGDGYTSADAHAQEHAHPTLLNPRTSPDGNKVFDYEYSRGRVKTSMRFTTDGDGTVESISITQRGKP